MDDSATPLLGPDDDQSRELFDRRSGDPGARDQLVALYRPLAENLARRYRASGEPLEDLVQVALLGLLKAVDRFEPDRGHAFPAFAVPTILGELKRHFRDQVWSVRVPRRLQENALAVRDAAVTMSQELGRPPGVAEIARRTGLAEDEVLEATDALGAYTATSLDAPLGEEDEATLVDRLATEDQAFEVAEGWAAVEPYLRGLPDRERRILVLRFFRGLTQSQIAEELGISQMHVSRLLSRTLDALRRKLADPHV